VPGRILNINSNAALNIQISKCMIAKTLNYFPFSFIYLNQTFLFYLYNFVYGIEETK